MESIDVVDLKRCAWANDAQLIEYHDTEWGVAPASDAEWLEKVVLETFQAGLSWKTILHKRDNFRLAFHEFSPRSVAAMTGTDIVNLMQNAGIIRHRKKIEAAVANAQIALQLSEQHGSLSRFFELLQRKPAEEIRASLQSTFRFTGPTTAESIAFATGLLPAPHEPGCWKSEPDC
ncbi:DNA-3-methyladenine glycosylase I [Alicyclobacillus sp. SO9]|uniref:DNA-3-methyladenine glycosylase I n=1 Tax=Alicyclobacillus sp. SO9 TaxID=2665646 RepID=UPI0018E78EC8|nr:DNA-3-methyladenine glycosylase I [Alicyclobacillus sp. SO9]QQE80237.1 DNA-3-methyladenine glycosylase I [Alicyclobacillus sp. SO9]